MPFNVFQPTNAPAYAGGPQVRQQPNVRPPVPGGPGATGSITLPNGMTVPAGQLRPIAERMIEAMTEIQGGDGELTKARLSAALKKAGIDIDESKLTEAKINELKAGLREADAAQAGGAGYSRIAGGDAAPAGALAGIDAYNANTDAATGGTPQDRARADLAARRGGGAPPAPGSAFADIAGGGTPRASELQEVGAYNEGVTAAIAARRARSAIAPPAGAAFSDIMAGDVARPGEINIADDSAPGALAQAAPPPFDPRTAGRPELQGASRFEDPGFAGGGALTVAPPDPGEQGPYGQAAPVAPGQTPGAVAPPPIAGPENNIAAAAYTLPGAAGATPAVGPAAAGAPGASPAASQGALSPIQALLQANAADTAKQKTLGQEDKSLALLTAGLATLAAKPTLGQGPLAGVATGMQAGINSLISQRSTRLKRSDKKFDQRLKVAGLYTDTMMAQAKLQALIADKSATREERQRANKMLEANRADMVAIREETNRLTQSRDKAKNNAAGAAAIKDIADIMLEEFPFEPTTPEEKKAKAARRQELDNSLLIGGAPGSEGAEKKKRSNYRKDIAAIQRGPEVYKGMTKAQRIKLLKKRVGTWLKDHNFGGI